MVAVGIDFGSINLTSSTYRDGDFSDPLRIRSHVALTPKRTLHTGDEARESFESDVKRGIYAVKQFVGQNEAECNETISFQGLPFCVVKNAHSQDDRDNPSFILEHQLFGSKSIWLSKSVLELTACSFQAVTRSNDKTDMLSASVVISVPTTFHSRQRELVTQSGQSVGFGKVTCLNEPLAAILGCLVRSPEAVGLRDVAYPLICNGGFQGVEMTVFRISSDGWIRQINTKFFDDLGGYTLTNKLVSYCMEKIHNSPQFGPDTKLNPAAHAQLRMACEKAQEILSKAADAKIEVRGLVDDENFVCLLTREEFEDLCHEIVRKMNDALHEFTFISQVDLERCELIAVGGLFRIPTLRQTVGWSSQKKVNSSVISYGQDVVAFGTAAAARLKQLDPQMFRNFTVENSFNVHHVLQTLKNGASLKTKSVHRQQSYSGESQSRPQQNVKKSLDQLHSCYGDIWLYDPITRKYLWMIPSSRLIIECFSNDELPVSGKYFVSIATESPETKIGDVLYRMVISENLYLEEIFLALNGHESGALVIYKSNSPNATKDFKVSFGLIFVLQKTQSPLLKIGPMLKDFDIIKYAQPAVLSTSNSEPFSPIFLARLTSNHPEQAKNRKYLDDWATITIHTAFQNGNYLLCYQLPEDDDVGVLLDLTMTNTTLNSNVSGPAVNGEAILAVSGGHSASFKLRFANPDIAHVLEKYIRKYIHMARASRYSYNEMLIQWRI